MTPVTCFLIGVLLSLVFTLLMIRTLRRSLADVLQELWSSPARATFWAAASCAAILLMGLLGGTNASAYPASAELEAGETLFLLVSQVRWTLMGLLASLVLVACLVLAFTSKAETIASRRRNALASDS